MTLRVTFKLSSPVCVDMYGVMFDALLLNVKLGALGVKAAKPHHHQCAAEELDALFKRDGLGLRRVSLGLFDSSELSTDFMCKRFDTSDALQYTEADKVLNTKGRYKNIKSVLTIRPAKTVSFLFAPNDADAIEKLCSEVLAVGKHGARGFGQVDSFSIESAGDAVWQSVIRPVPRRLFIGDFKSVQYRTFEPPYWDMRNAEECVVNGTFSYLV